MTTERGKSYALPVPIGEFGYGGKFFDINDSNTLQEP